MKEMLQKAIASVSTPEWMTRDCKEANRAVADADFARAIALLKNILEDGKDRPVQGKARAVARQPRAAGLRPPRRARHLIDTGKPPKPSMPSTRCARRLPARRPPARATRW